MILRPSGQNPDATASALGDLRALDWASDTRPTVLAYTPVSNGNPYQALLYSRMLGQNILPARSTGINGAAAILDQVSVGMGRILHLHWLNVVMAKSPDRDSARSVMEEFLATVERLHDEGVRVVWTCHNVLPHDHRFEDLEVELRQRVIDIADAVHVMSTRTVELCAPYFEIPADKIVSINHPSFASVYPSWVSRAEARRYLGLSDDLTVWLLLGGLRPYKGLTELLAAVNEVALANPGKFALVVAGEPDRSPEVAAVIDECITNPAVHVLARRVTDPEVQYFTAAADASVAPYRRSLNSGAVVLSLSHGLPVVLSSASGALPLVDAACAVTYDEDQPNALVGALLESVRLANPAARAAAAARGRELDADDIATRFATAMRSLVDSPSLAPGVPA